jgi:hypothetical protein
MVDAAETFTESDVSLSKSGIRITGGSAELQDGATASESYGSASTTQLDIPGGWQITPLATVGEVTVTLPGTNSTEYDRIKILTADGQSTVRDEPIDLSTFSQGDTMTLSGLSLTAGTSYAVVLDRSSTTDETTYVKTLSSDPSANSLYDYNGWLNGNERADLYAFSALSASQPVVTSGTMAVGWPAPTDIYAWDRATFQRSEPSGSVGVYVEVDDGSGWSEVAGPISRGDSIPADPGDSVRFRVELSRPSSGDPSPTLDAIYRRWVV